MEWGEGIDRHNVGERARQSGKREGDETHRVERGRATRHRSLFCPLTATARPSWPCPV